jgi:Protein of unknown function (DUF998)
MVRKILLVGGVLSSLLYVIGIDVIVALRYPDYHNYADQMVSELLAVGAPTRALMVWLCITYNVLVFALAVGVWAAAEGKRATRFTAAALIGYGAVSTAGLLLFPMDVRGTVDSQRDTRSAQQAAGLRLILCDRIGRSEQRNHDEGQSDSHARVSLASLASASTILPARICTIRFASTTASSRSCVT